MVFIECDYIMLELHFHAIIYLHDHNQKHSAQDLEEIFKILTQNNKPIELNFSNGFQLLIAVILSARTTASHSAINATKFI